MTLVVLESLSAEKKFIAKNLARWYFYFKYGLITLPVFCND